MKKVRMNCDQKIIYHADDRIFKRTIKNFKQSYGKDWYEKIAQLLIVNPILIAFFRNELKEKHYKKIMKMVHIYYTSAIRLYDYEEVLYECKQTFNQFVKCIKINKKNMIPALKIHDERTIFRCGTVT